MIDHRRDRLSAGSSWVLCSGLRPTLRWEVDGPVVPCRELVDAAR